MRKTDWLKMSRLFKAGVFISVFWVIVGCGGSGNSETAAVSMSGADGKISVVVLHLNHWPVKSVLDQIKETTDSFGDSVETSFFTFNSEQGSAIAREANVQEHTPLVIFVNGSMEHEMDGRTVTFYSFPEGEGTFMMEGGSWSVEDLAEVLSRMEGE